MIDARSIARIVFFVSAMALAISASTDSLAAAAYAKHSVAAKVVKPKVYKLSALEKDNLQYVLNNTAPLVPHQLNLADPKQYAYVMDTLRRFGRTAKTSPKLFKMIDEARKGQASPPKLMATADLQDGSGSAVLGGLNYTPSFGADGQGNYRTNSYSSYPPGQIPYNTQVLVSLIDKDRSVVLNSGSANQYNTTNVQVPVSAAAPTDHSDVISNTLFLVAPSQGQPLKSFTVTLEDYAAVTAPCQLSPGYSPAIGTNQQCQTNAATACVNNGSITNKVKVCYGNRIQNDCDYGCVGSSNPPNIIFPIQGSVNLGQTPATPLTGSLYIVLNSLPSGGCTLVATANTVGSLTNLISVDNSNVASWNLAPAQFPNTNCLVPTNSGTGFNYSFQLFVQTASSAVGATFTSDSSQFPLPDTFPVPQLNVLIGCLPAGVQIRMADGSEKAVETFSGRDEKVRSSVVEDRAVTATTTGHEDLPLVYVRDSAGHSLMLTEGHPVLTTKGAVMASKLKVGDVVLTESGEAALVEVGRQKNTEPVPIYNLSVGTETEAARGQTTFYANGILVGDQQMQQYLAVKDSTPRPMTQREILHALPVAWRQDYQNSLRH